MDTEGVEAMYGEEEEDDEATEGDEEEPCPNSDGDKATDAPCPGIQELSLADREEGEHGKEEGEDLRSPQGSYYCSTGDPGRGEFGSYYMYPCVWV